MPRFIKGGPIVPDRLVQELEEDRVVIFCGAGISMGAGLPDFRGLVEHCYTELGAPMPPKKSSEWNWLDRMLGSLEADFPDQMRHKVKERLEVPHEDLAIHEAILKLARLKGPENGIRLVTTNFDQLFEKASAGIREGQAWHSGPVLPIPLNDRSASWRSIVYLHGRLDTTGGGNQHLVLTSADFGRAYLTDAWAARFVARLFAEFTVLFIGYSLNDPVLRYMTDAFAAEDALARSGRKRPPAYLFVSYKGRTPPAASSWHARRLEPIFYRAAYKHRALKNTLVEWATARQDYQTSVRQIVQRNGPGLPNALEPSESKNLVWSVCDRPDDAARGAKVFAALEPPPPIEWLAVFERRDTDAQTAYREEVALAKRQGRDPAPAPTYHIETLFASFLDNSGAPVSEQAFALIPWIVRHLENRSLTDWVIAKLQAGRRPHRMLRRAIRQRLDRPPVLANGIAIFWRTVSSEGDWVVSQPAGTTFFDPRNLKAYMQNAAWCDQELRSAMRPYLKLMPRFYLSSVTNDPARLFDIAKAEVAFNEGGIFAHLDRMRAPDPYWADRLDMLTQLLRQVLDLYAAVGEADAQIDPTAFQRPSIEPHLQNRHHDEWARLYDLIWRGWVQVDTTNALDSRHWIERWRRIPYLGFRRLVLAAVRRSAHFTPAEKLEVLLNG